MSGLSLIQGNKVDPVVSLKGSILALNSWSNTQVVTTLPTGMPASTFHLTLTNTSGSSLNFDLTSAGVEAVVRPNREMERLWR